jgi:hypothetical protein
MTQFVSCVSTTPVHQHRRGMLLLLVLLMLAIFLGLGIFAMTVASRSRTSARAFVDVQSFDTDTALMSQSLLDQAFMKLLRGPSAPGSSVDIPESLLEDMYCGERDLNRNNVTLSGTAGNDDQLAEPDIESGILNLDGDPRQQPARSDSLTGRLLSWAPSAGPFSIATVEIYFENDKLDSDNLWIAAQDLNNNGMFDPRPGVKSPLPLPVPPDPPINPLSASPPVVFNGRVITFAPPNVLLMTAGTSAVSQVAGRSVPPLSYRIVRSDYDGSPAGAPTYRCRYRFLVADLLGSPLRWVPATPSDVVINGPAFRVDPCDHPGEPWLAGFAGNQVDNDNDGTADGRWMSQVLPTLRGKDGRSIKCDVSILVRDLDGRINVNAHGMTRRHSQTGRPYRARSEYGYLRRTVPIGLGYGPADIDASALFSTVPGFVPDGSAFPARLDKWYDGRIVPVATQWDVLLRGDADATVSLYPTPDPAPWLTRRPAPVLGGVIGRYGADGVPGVVGQDAITQNQDNELALAPYGSLTAKSNSPADLKGRMQVVTQQPDSAAGVATGTSGVATLLFYSPDTDSDFTDDPYELRLDRSGPRLGPNTPTADPSVDSLYTVAELERVLRQFDSDASYLAPRLAAALGPRIREDRDEDGELDPAEPSQWQEDSQVRSPPDDPVAPENKKYRDDGEDKAELTSIDGEQRSLAPNGILDDGEDTNGNGYLDLAIDLNGSGFRDMPEDRNQNSDLDRYWPKDAFNPADNSNPLEPFPRAMWERDFTQTLRDLITTESWDTPGLTGLAAARIEKYLVDNPATIAHFSPDCLSGLRFDINRPFPVPPLEAQAKQDYCKHFFYLLRALGVASPAEAAQWAVNVVDFRDADSVMTLFRYDTTPDNGWDVDNSSPVVIGAERPELLITEAAAWFKGQTQGQLFVTLHRPWNAIARTFKNVNPVSPPQLNPPSMAEPVDPRLSNGCKEKNDRNSNGIVEEPSLDLQLRCPGSANPPYPVWRLVLRTAGNPDKIVRFDDPQAPGANEFTATTNRVQLNDLLAMPTNSYLCVTSGPPQHITVSGDTFPIDSAPLFITTTGTIELRRVADPSLAWNSQGNPYVVVDRVVVTPTELDAQTNQPLPPGWRQAVQRAKTDPQLQSEFDQRPDPTLALTNLWKPAPPPPPTPTAPKMGEINYIAPWLHWPNRPLISVGELLLIPRQDSVTWLQNYKIPCIDPGSSGGMAERLVFDACHVYSRFAGNRITLSGSAASLIGADLIPFDQLSTWREPGRVNLFTGTSKITRAMVAGRLDGRAYPSLTVSGSAGQLKPPMTPTATLLCPQSAAVFANASAEYAIKQAGLVAPPNKKDYIPFNPSQNPAFYLNTAIRIPNVATTRSHVFAIWITLRLTDSSDPTNVSFHRMFAIVDRSIPVGFLHGMDLNVRDTVLLQRYLD